MDICIVVAAARNGVIGRDNQLIWHLPADLKRFKEITMGHPIIMGRKTFESIGKPLPGRTSIIITRNKDYKVGGAIVVGSLQEAIDKCVGQERVSIIGGAEIYRQAINIATTIYMTKIDADFEGDVHFEMPSEKEWKLQSEESIKKDEKNAYPFLFLTYKKIK